MSVRRLYESTYIINAALEDAEIESVIARTSEYIEQHGGKMASMSICLMIFHRLWLQQ